MPSSLSVRIRGVGPIYVATEARCTVLAHLSRSWITEMAPPYRKGHGWRLRFGRRAIQVGVCHKTKVEEDKLIEHAGWRRLDLDAGEIHKW